MAAVIEEIRIELSRLRNIVKDGSGDSPEYELSFNRLLSLCLQQNNFSFFDDNILSNEDSIKIFESFVKPWLDTDDITFTDLTSLNLLKLKRSILFLAWALKSNFLNEEIISDEDYESKDLWILVNKTEFHKIYGKICYLTTDCSRLYSEFVADLETHQEQDESEDELRLRG